MKRFHVNVSVNDLSESVKFYTALFAAEPTVLKEDYAKWMLDDPRVNFAIARRGHALGVNHLGFQVDSASELTGMREQLTRADHAFIEQSGSACCYANADKYWVTDPTGIAWETFHTLEAIPFYGEDTDFVAKPSACGAPREVSAPEPCCPTADASRGATCRGG